MTVTEPIVNLTFARQLVQNSHTEFQEYPTNALVADIGSRTYRRTRSSHKSVLFSLQILPKTTQLIYVTRPNK
jgi:hypothetical protein